MSLGFSVETLLPAARMGGPLRMGLTRIEDRDWLDPAPDLALRKAAFDACPEAVAALPAADAGISELADMLGIDGGLEACARSVWEDLCVMVQDGPGEPFRLAAAAVAFPTDWRVADKLGRPVHGVHAPVPGYAAHLAGGVDRFMDGLQSFNIFGRVNAHVVPSADLRYLPAEPMDRRFAAVTPDNAGDTLFARCEREVLRRLPRSRAIIFSIGIYRAPLSSLGDEAVIRLASALDGYDNDELERRGAAHYGVALQEYARKRAGNRRFAA